MSRTLRVLLVTVGALSVATAVAGTVHVSVTTADGKPATDTAVQLQVLGATLPPPRAEPVLIVQKDIRFVPFVTAVPVGTTVRFVNRDSFDHHVRSQPGGPLASIAPAKQFEFRLAKMRGKTETSADLQLDVVGSIVLGCHLHGSMRGHILVTNSPWTAVTDDAGHATFEDVPEGTVELVVWHPDQLVDQPSVKLQVGAETNADSRLNFTPRKRPPPLQRRRDEYDY